MNCYRLYIRCSYNFAICKSDILVNWLFLYKILLVVSYLWLVCFLLRVFFPLLAGRFSEI